MIRPFLALACLVLFESGLLAEGDGALATSPSTFVRVHGDSPVRWTTWGEAAFARAKAENKPVYVLVGSLTQELARAMREQSFAREENAAMLNEHFVPIVVDREEHPDLAAFLQAYVGTVKQMQGWPLSVWLTPELKPFEGATYLPPSDEWGKEGFPNALRRVLSAWQTDPDAQRAKADEALAALAAAVPTEPPAPVDADAVNTLLAEATAAWMATYDATNGGFGEPPRRLEPELLRFLLQREDKNAREAALASLHAVLVSPMRDPLDGGFFRSAGDTAWRQPTLQKTLSDQARAVLAYGAARTMADEPAFDRAVVGAVGYLLAQGTTDSLDSPYRASEDWTPEALTPSLLWTTAEVRAVVGDQDFPGIAAVLGLSEEGNLPADAFLGVDSSGKNLPRFEMARLGQVPADVLAGAESALLMVRNHRPAPLRDGPATAGAHGYLLAALVASGHSLPARTLGAAATLLRTEMLAPDGTLRTAPGFGTSAGARDYALVADGLLAFAALAKDEAARRDALALIAKADALFWNPEAGRYMASPRTLAPGIGVRVAPLAPDAGDLPSAESAMLLLLAKHDLGDAAHRAALAAAIAADMRDALTPARGDQLLALQAWVAGQ